MVVQLVLMMRDGNHPCIPVGEKLFSVPVQAPEKEKSEILEVQILTWLITLSTHYEDYDKAIKEVERWLKNFIGMDSRSREWIVRAADAAGESFLLEVKKAKTRQKNGQVVQINLGEFFRTMFQ